MYQAALARRGWVGIVVDRAARADVLGAVADGPCRGVMSGLATLTANGCSARGSRLTGWTPAAIDRGAWPKGQLAYVRRARSERDANDFDRAIEPRGATKKGTPPPKKKKRGGNSATSGQSASTVAGPRIPQRGGGHDRGIVKAGSQQAVLFKSSRRRQPARSCCETPTHIQTNLHAPMAIASR